MERLTTERYGSLLIKNNDGEYRSPCFGCETINKCHSGKTPLSCGFYTALKQLKEYEDLEEQGKLLKLPCTVGDTAYIVKGDKVLRNYVVQIHIAQVEAQTFFSCYDDCFGIEQIGKTVFLTREEAEAALKKLSAPEGK